MFFVDDGQKIGWVLFKRILFMRLKEAKSRMLHSELLQIALLKQTSYWLPV